MKTLLKISNKEIRGFKNNRGIIKSKMIEKLNTIESLQKYMADEILLNVPIDFCLNNELDELKKSINQTLKHPAVSKKDDLTIEFNIDNCAGRILNYLQNSPIYVNGIPMSAEMILMLNQSEDN